jgi:hypothetical protein
VVLSSPLHKAFAAAKNLLGKGKRSRNEELREWLDAHPEIAEESKKGFEDIRAGRYRKISRRQGNV